MTISKRTDPAVTTKRPAATARRGATTHDTRSRPTHNAKNMGTRMCNLQTHMDRDHRAEEAKRAEPVYAALANEYGIDYEPPTADN